MKFVLSFLIAIIFSFSSHAQDRISEIETEFSKYFAEELFKYQGWGNQLPTTDSIKLPSFLESIRAITERESFLWNITRLESMLRDHVLVFDWGTQVQAEKEELVRFVKLFALASSSLPEELSGRNRVDTQTWNHEIETSVKQLISLDRRLLPDEVAKLEDIFTRIQDVKIQYEVSLKYIRWEGKTNFSEFRNYVEVVFLRALFYVAQEHHLTETEFLKLVEDFKNSTNGLLELNKMVHDRLNFNDYRTGVETNYYLLTRNSASRLLNSMMIMGDFPIRELIEIKSTGNDRRATTELHEGEIEPELGHLKFIRDVVALIKR